MIGRHQALRLYENYNYKWLKISIIFFISTLSSIALPNGEDLHWSKSEGKEANLGKTLVFQTFFTESKYITIICMFFSVVQ